MRDKVFLARCITYSPLELDPLIDKAFSLLGVYDRLKKGMQVVIKPNLVIGSKPEEAIITHPAFTAAVGRCVKKTGADVIIAESPGGPYTPPVMKAIFRTCGYTDMARENGFQLYTACKSREVSLPAAVRCRTLSVAEPFLERDFLIDLAKLKTHSMVGFSGAVKNLFGAVPGLQKPELHCRFPEKQEFSQMLVDLCAFLQPDLCFFDGVWAMEGNGPTGGSRRDLGAIGAALSPYALDVCAASVVGIAPEEILMLKEAARRGLGPLSTDDIDMVGESIPALLMPDFKQAQTKSTDFIDKLPKPLRPVAKKITTPYPRIRKNACVGCGKCAESCPQHTIDIKDGKAIIKYKNCIRCFCCHEMCPKHVVDIRRFSVFGL